MAPLRRRAPAQSACTAEGGLPVEQPAKQGKDGEKRGDVVTVYEHDSDEGVFVVDDGKTEDVVEEETFECDVCDDGSQRPLYVGGCSNDDDECDCELTVDEEDKDQDIDDLCEAYTAARDDMDDVIEAYRRLTAMPKDEVMPEESPEEQPPAAAETEEPQVQPNPDDREGGAEVAPPAEVPAAPPSDEMAADTKVHRRLAGKRAVSPAEVRPPKAPKVEPEGPLPIPQAKMPRLSEDVCSVLLASVVSDTVEDEKELRVLYVNSEDPEVLEGMESVMESLRVPAQHSYEGVPGGSTAGTALRAPAAAAPHLGASGSRLFEEQQVATLQELLARHLRAQGAPRAAAWLAGRGAAGLPAASQAGEVARERLAIGAAEEKERVKEYKQKQWKRIYQLAELIISLKAAGKSAAIETTEVSVLKAAILQLLPQAEQQKSISKRAEILKDKIQRVEKQLGAFTVDIYNCMFGRNENSLNLFQIGDLARVSAVASQHHAGMEIDSPNAHVDHTVSQPATAANCQVKHVPTLPELFDQVQWRLQLSWDYRGMLLHPFADLALRMHPPRPSTDQATHHVYTDASLYSKSPELAAFALAHVTQDSTGFACQGYVAARAATSHSFDNMAEQTHSTEVELLGAVWAAIFSLQLPFDEQVYIICDNMAAVDKALSRVRLVSELDKMAATVPRDVQCVRPISVVQEPGHQDYPWNEAVDSISRHFTKESTVPPDLPQVPRQALRYTVDAEWQFTRSAEPVQDIFGYSSKMILCYWLASSEVTDVSGSIGPTDSLDFNGFELQKISNQYSMKITNTFLPHEHPETFRAKCGTLHRLDYILLQGSIHACVKTCYVMTDLDLGGKSPDHWPVVVTIEAAKYYTTPEAGRKRLDRQKLADPIRRNKFRQALLEMPVPPWATDINQQVDDFNCKINQLTAELFAEDRFSPRKPYIKTGTMALIRLLRFNGKQAKRCDHTLLPQRFKQDGSVIASELEWAETLRRHFAQLEDGYECTASALQTEYNQLSLNHALGFPRSSSAIPSPTWLATRIRGVKAHRAPGHDLVQNAVPKAAPEAVLPHILAITAKTGLLVQEAVIHKAGLACGLHKGKSDRMTAEMYRSIMLNSDVIKHHHAFLRAAMSDCIEMLMVDSQTGGIKGRCVGMASQMVRVFRHIAKARKFIAIVLFVDLVAAFYSLLRQAGIPLKGTEKYINQVLDNALALAHPLLEVVLAAPVLVDPRVDQHLVAQVIEAHRLTHFRVPGDTQWIVSQRSSRAGNPLADFFFNAVYARPLRGIRFDMQQAGIAMDLKDCIDASEQVFSQGLTVESDAFTDSTFVDDSGFCSPCYDPTAVRDQVSLLGRIVRKHMLGSGFQLHFGKGKTAAVISYNGEGSLHAKRTMAKFSAIALDSTSNDRIVLEQAYKHVGGIYHGDESTGQEVARRKNKHSTALRPLRASVIKPEIAMKDKLKYIDALCSTHLFFQAETWDKISASCTTKLNHALLSGYRVGTRKLHSLLTVGRIADSEVLVIANRMEFCDVLRFRRLRSVARLVHSGSSTLRLLLDATLGVAGVLVHQVSVAHRAASIWQLESVKALAALPEASSVTFDVADFGGLRSSFGQALAVHCPHLSAAMLQRGLVARPAAALEDNNWVLPRPFLVLLGEAFLEAQPALCGGGALQWPTDPFLEAMLLPPERYPEVPSDEDQAWANPFDFLVTRRIRVVADAAAASDFAESMRQVAARAGGAAAAAVALDAEWRPDGAGAAQSAPALLQVACQEGPVQVWLLDLKWLCCRETPPRSAGQLCGPRWTRPWAACCAPTACACSGSPSRGTWTGSLRCQAWTASCRCAARWTSPTPAPRRKAPERPPGSGPGWRRGCEAGRGTRWTRASSAPTGSGARSAPRRWRTRPPTRPACSSWRRGHRSARPGRAGGEGDGALARERRPRRGRGRPSSGQPRGDRRRGAGGVVRGARRGAERCERGVLESAGLLQAGAVGGGGRSGRQLGPERPVPRAVAPEAAEQRPEGRRRGGGGRRGPPRADPGRRAAGHQVAGQLAGRVTPPAPHGLPARGRRALRHPPWPGAPRAPEAWRPRPGPAGAPGRGRGPAGFGGAPRVAAAAAGARGRAAGARGRRGRRVRVAAEPCQLPGLAGRRRLPARPPERPLACWRRPGGPAGALQGHRGALARGAGAQAPDDGGHRLRGGRRAAAHRRHGAAGPAAREDRRVPAGHRLSPRGRAGQADRDAGGANRRGLPGRALPAPRQGRGRAVLGAPGGVQPAGGPEFRGLPLRHLQLEQLVDAAARRRGGPRSPSGVGGSVSSNRSPCPACHGISA
ncbi:unnamed protein product, partial [Prorocentrum cordatum]